MAKATHTGTCQWCGRRQMLPGGMLAKHGYDLAHGFMRGVCYGAGHLPFEQSKDLIEKAIGWALDEAARLRRFAAEQRAIPESVRECHSHVYRPDLSTRSRGAVYLWTAGRVEGDGFEAVFVWQGRGEQRARLHRGPGAIGGAIARGFRHDYAKALEAAAVREDEYIAWQRRRIAGWQPVELTPRAAA